MQTDIAGHEGVGVVIKRISTILVKLDGVLTYRQWALRWPESSFIHEWASSKILKVLLRSSSQPDWGQNNLGASADGYMHPAILARLARWTRRLAQLSSTRDE